MGRRTGRSEGFRGLTPEGGNFMGVGRCECDIGNDTGDVLATTP